MAEIETPKSKREIQIERLRARYPEKEFVDDEEIFGQISDDYDQHEQALSEYQSREKTLSDMFAADPRSAQFLTDMHQGKSPWASYIRLFGSELKDTLDDPETIEQIKEAEKDYLERVSRSKELDAEYDRNIETTKEMLRTYQSERGMTDEQIDEVFAVLLGIVRDGVMGKFLPETLDMIVKAVNHDADVEAAAAEGEVAGRNAKITEKLRKSREGDGIEPLGGQNTLATESRNGGTIFDLANSAL